MKYVKWLLLAILDVLFNIIAYFTNPLISLSISPHISLPLDSIFLTTVSKVFIILSLPISSYFLVWYIRSCENMVLGFSTVYPFPSSLVLIISGLSLSVPFSTVTFISTYLCPSSVFMAVSPFVFRKSPNTDSVNTLMAASVMMVFNCSSFNIIASLSFLIYKYPTIVI